MLTGILLAAIGAVLLVSLTDIARGTTRRRALEDGTKEWEKNKRRWYKVNGLERFRRGM